MSSLPLEVERRPKTLEESFCYSVDNQLRSGALVLAVHKNRGVLGLNLSSCALPWAPASVGQDRIPRICIFNKLFKWCWRMWSLWSHTATSGLGGLWNAFLTWRLSKAVFFTMYSIDHSAYNTGWPTSSQRQIVNNSSFMCSMVSVTIQIAIVVWK